MFRLHFFLGLLFIYKIFILYSAGELRQAIFASALGGNSYELKMYYLVNHVLKKCGNQHPEYSS